MTDQPLASRIFGVNDLIAFARLSSDWNPMHLDQAFARRTQVGAPVVHGIHNLAWAANAVLHSFPLKISNIRARFLQPLYLDELASVRIRNRTDLQIEFEVVAANTVVAVFKLSSGPAKFAADPQLASAATTQISQPADLPFEQLIHQSGAVATGDADPRSLFPALTDAIGLPAIKALLATSQIVGMACPGLHSLFAGLELSCHPGADRDSALAYAVSKADPRFRSLQIDVSGSGIAGRLARLCTTVPAHSADHDGDITARCRKPV